MRFPLLALLALAVIPLAAAETYTVYSDGGNVSPATNVTFAITPFFTSNQQLIDIDVAALQRARDGNNTNQTATATAALRSALLSAKTTDPILISSPWKNVLLHYKECGDTGPYHVCYTELIFPEEDGPPLGGSSYTRVKFANGTYKMPITLTITELQTKLYASRTLNVTTVYPGDTIGVKLDVSNTGNQPVDAVTITDTSPLTITSGTASAFTGSLLSGTDLITSYVVTANDPGTYVFHGTVQPTSGANLSDSTLTVLSPQNFTITAPAVIAGTDGTITVALTNLYTTPVTVSGFSLSTNQVFTTVQNAPAGKRLTKTTLSFDTFTIPKNGNATFTVGYTTTAPGTATFAASAHVNQPVDRTIQTSATATVNEPGIAVATSLDGLTARLDFTNTAAAPITDIIIDWGNRKGTQDHITTLVSTDYRSFTYGTPGTYAVHLTYTIGKLERSRFITIIIPQNASNGTTLVVPILNATVPPTTNVSPAPPEPTSAPTQPPITPAASTEGPGKSWITSFLDWLDGLFH